MKTLEADDLIERLHNWEHVYPQDCDKPEGSLYIEAAEALAAKDAEIARLRGLLFGMVNIWSEVSKAVPPLQNQQEFIDARAALTGEKGNE